MTCYCQTTISVDLPQKRKRFVPIGEIECFRAEHKYILARLTDGSERLLSAQDGKMWALKTLKAEPELEGFIFSERGHLVNKSHIKGMTHNEGRYALELTSGFIAPVSRRNNAAVRKAVSRW